VTLRDIALDRIICSFQSMLPNVLTTTITMKVLWTSCTEMRRSITTPQSLILSAALRKFPPLQTPTLEFEQSASSRKRTTSNRLETGTDHGHQTGKTGLLRDGWRFYRSHVSPTRSAASGSLTGLRLIDPWDRNLQAVWTWGQASRGQSPYKLSLCEVQSISSIYHRLVVKSVKKIITCVVVSCLYNNNACNPKNSCFLPFYSHCLCNLFLQ